MSYLSQNNNSSSAIKIKSQTTSASIIEEVKPYKFENTPIKFTEKKNIEESIISEETEKKFYKKVFN